MNVLFAFLVGLLAFIPPASYVLGQWEGQIKEMKTLHAKLSTIWYDVNGNPTQLDEELWLKRPGQMRRTLKTQRGRLDYFVTPARSIRISGGKSEAVPTLEAMGPVGIFYLPEGSRRLGAVLRQVGISTDATRLTLQDRRILYEIGQAGQALAWFSKDDWLPAGVQVGGREYRLTTNLPSRFAIPFPEIWEVLANQKRIEVSRTLSLETAASIPDSVFDVNSLKGVAPKP
ncbi:MAG: hypothetical protein V1798_03660 [Pseudomonadota bacterium]